MKNKERNFNRDGRPPIYGEPLKRTTVFLQLSQIEWIDGKSSNRSEVVRRLIDKAIKAEKAS